MEELPLESFHYVLILADEDREDRPLDSDAHNLATLMLIRDHRSRIAKAEVKKHARRQARKQEAEQRERQRANAVRRERQLEQQRA